MGATPISGQQSQSNYDQGMGIIKGVGNFLFPIVGDIKHDIEQGTFQKKSFYMKFVRMLNFLLYQI